MNIIENISIVIITIGFLIIMVVGGAMVSISMYVLVGLDIIEGDKKNGKT